MSELEPNLNDPKLLRAGDAVARMSRPSAPSGLAARTLARISARFPVKRVFWMMRPITHPVARIAAAALIIYTLAPLTDLDFASKLGAELEQHVFGKRVEDRVEAFVDGVLIEHYSTSETDGYMPTGSFGPAHHAKDRPAALRAHTGT